jgi:BolA protein
VPDSALINEEWSMDIQASIERKLNLEFRPTYQLIENESHRHGGGAGDSHFKLTVVSENFAGLNRVKRHQSVYALLADEMAGPVHALALHLYSPAEWVERANTRPDSPDCRGGSRVV